MKTGFIFAGVLAALAACGPLHTVSPIEGLVRGAVSGALGDDSASGTPAAAAPLTRAAIEAADRDLLRISLIEREATALLSLAATNGTKATWFTSDGLSFTFDRGVLVGTRGLGADVLGSDVDGAVAAMRRGGNYARTLDFLDGLDQIERRVYQCVSVRTGEETITIFERSYRTAVVEETCTGETEAFKNTYWRDSAGTIWQSRQWISPTAGFLGYQRL